MIPGIGIDLLHLPRLATLLTRRNAHYLHRFAQRILTESEYRTFTQRLQQPPQQPPQQPSSSIRPDQTAHIRWLGVRWAAKEAAFKATGSTRGALGWKEVEVGYYDSGQPYLDVLKGGRRRGGLSISHDGEYVVAMAMLPMGAS